MAIRATDDEALANQLWGDDKVWDEERQQYVPTEKKGEEPSAGNKSATSSDVTEKKSDEKQKSPRPTALTTERTSKLDPEETGTAPSTGGSGKKGSPAS